jgi:Phosphopantetheine attachment site
MDNDTPNGVSGARTGTESKLGEIWSEILNTAPIGVHDQFLDLGGESIVATRCRSRIRSTFRVDLPLSVFFGEAASVAQMARMIDQLQTRGNPGPAATGN